MQASNIVWVVPSGSGARVKDSGAIAPIGRWISRRDESCRAAIRPHDPSPSGRGQRPTGRAGQLDRGLGFRYPRGRKVRPLRTGINKHSNSRRHRYMTDVSCTTTAGRFHVSNTARLWLTMLAAKACSYRWHRFLAIPSTLYCVHAYMMHCFCSCYPHRSHEQRGLSELLCRNLASNPAAPPLKGVTRECVSACNRPRSS